MKIGQAAAQLGIATHVLRHWEDEGVVVPARSAVGHRIYEHEHLVRCRIVLSCQGVGMSLADIRSVLHRGDTGRAEVIAARISAIRSQKAVLDSAEKFLLHVRQCRHDLMTRCPDCSEYAECGSGGPGEMTS